MTSVNSDRLEYPDVSPLAIDFHVDGVVAFGLIKIAICAVKKDAATIICCISCMKTIGTKPAALFCKLILP